MTEHTADARLAALSDWLTATLAGSRVRARARVGRRELPPLLPRDAGVAAPARAGRRDADRDGRAAADGELPAVRARRAAAARRRASTRRACSRRTSTRGFLLLSDLGTTTYLAALDAANAHELYLDAIDALVRFQRTSREGVLPPYDEALLRRELDLFPDWYVARHLGRALDDAAARKRSTRVFGAILANNLAQPRVFVHRDYHSRNLMVSAPNPGVLDFQDAVYGPITYDLVSLLRDAYVEWDEERQIDWAVRYWERARAAGVPVDADFGAFWRDFEWMGVQRQLKVLGIFARLYHRDGKAGYLADMPRVMRYLRGACARYRELEPLLALLDALEDRAPAVGCTCYDGRATPR